MKTEKIKAVFSSLLMKKIEHMCAIRPENEWSGVPFYRVYEEDGKTVIEIEDMALMDAMGSPGFTSFNDKDPYANSYIANHRNLIGCYMGLLHSHHNMTLGPSLVDDDTMRKEGDAPDRTNFLSIIVYNDRNKTDYSIRISQKRRTEVKAGNSYANEFGVEVCEGQSTMKFKDHEDTEIVVIKEREYKPSAWNETEEKEFLDRIEELEKKKKREEDVMMREVVNFDRTQYRFKFDDYIGDDNIVDMDFDEFDLAYMCLRLSPLYLPLPKEPYYKRDAITKFIQSIPPYQVANYLIYCTEEIISSIAESVLETMVYDGRELWKKAVDVLKVFYTVEPNEYVKDILITMKDIMEEWEDQNGKKI